MIVVCSVDCSSSIVASRRFLFTFPKQRLHGFVLSDAKQTRIVHSTYMELSPDTYVNASLVNIVFLFSVVTNLVPGSVSHLRDKI